MICDEELGNGEYGLYGQVRWEHVGGLASNTNG
jgi:hypothetical protein